MESFDNLEREWCALDAVPIKKWTLPDFYLAARLCKMMMKSNKLQGKRIHEQQNIIKDQTEQITYMSKQLTALWEANNSRMTIYEQLEDKVHNFEKVNQCLTSKVVEHKKRGRQLNSNLIELEDKCCNLERTVTSLQEEIRASKLKCSTPVVDRSSGRVCNKFVCDVSLQLDFTPQDFCNSTFAHQDVVTRGIQTDPQESELEQEVLGLKEQISTLTTELDNVYSQHKRDQITITDLELEVETAQMERSNCESKLSMYLDKQDGKSLYEELSFVANDQQSFCQRCSNIIDDEDEFRAGDDDDTATVGAVDGTTTDEKKDDVPVTITNEIELKDDNVETATGYAWRRRPLVPTGQMVRELVNKYEALVNSLKNSVF